MLSVNIDKAKVDQIPPSLKAWHEATDKGPRQLVAELGGVESPLGWRAKLAAKGYI